MVSFEAMAYLKECNGYEKQYQEKIATFTETNLKHTTLFTGSSSIRQWPELGKYFSLNDNKNQYLNRGFGGSQICHLLVNFEKIFMGRNERQHPKRIILYSGDNDLNAGVKPEVVVKHYQELINMIREAGIKAKVYIMSIKPSPARLHLLDKIQKTNVLIANELTQNENVHFVDTFNDFFYSNGQLKKDLFWEDGIHFKNEHYHNWAKKLEQMWLINEYLTDK